MKIKKKAKLLVGIYLGVLVISMIIGTIFDFFTPVFILIPIGVIVFLMNSYYNKEAIIGGDSGGHIFHFKNKKVALITQIALFLLIILLGYLIAIFFL